MRPRTLLWFVLPALMLWGGERAVAWSQDAPAEPPKGESARVEADLCQPVDEAARSVLDSLEQRERKIEQQEATLAAREADLRLVEGETQSRLTELKALRDEIKALLSQVDKEREAKVVSLVGVVEGMKPNNAADMLAKTEQGLAVEVISRMGKSKAAKVLAAMPASDSARLAAAMTRAKELPKIEELQ